MAEPSLTPTPPPHPASLLFASPSLLLLLLLLCQSVRTEKMCRVLVIPRTVFKALTQDFPISTRQIMTNLVDRAEQVGGQGARLYNQCDEVPSDKCDEVIVSVMKCRMTRVMDPWTATVLVAHVVTLPANQKGQSAYKADKVCE